MLRPKSTYAGQNSLPTRHRLRTVRVPATGRKHHAHAAQGAYNRRQG